MANLTRQGEKKIQNYIEDEVAPSIRDRWINNLTSSQQTLAGDIQIFSDSESVQVGSRNEILKFLEWGVDPHVITPNKADALVWTNDAGEKVFATKVDHPGFEAFGHMRSAVDETRVRFKTQ